jgi:ABC-type nitrate/sulfonate/bicarbonate transport system substrate-binding protein
MSTAAIGIGKQRRLGEEALDAPLGARSANAIAFDCRVALQLNWKHQFQFAGHYMALEKGFYTQAGLGVEIREGGPSIDAAEDIEDRKVDFGVCTSSVLLAEPSRTKLVVLGVIFQHSAAVILTPSRSRITTPSELKHRWLMDTAGSDDLAAMLKQEGWTMPRCRNVAGGLVDLHQ